MNGFPFLFAEPLIGLIALPVLAPIVALLQLLFPGLMRNQYQQYKTAIHVMLTQSTVMFLHWLGSLWFAAQRPWWLREEVLGGTLLAIGIIGVIWALVRRWSLWQQPADLQRLPPARIEFIALGCMAVVGLGWAIYQSTGGGSMLDPMLALTFGCVMAVVHLAVRTTQAVATSPRFDSTELALLTAMSCTGIGIAAYTSSNNSPQIETAAIRGEWPTYRGSFVRSGADGSSFPATKPTLLWSFDPQEKKGRVRFHSTPTVVDGLLVIGGMKQILTLTEGVVYGVSVNGDPAAKITPGQMLWRFTDDGNLKPVFSSASIFGGRMYFGEGYHQDANCRLFCLEPHSGKPLWGANTSSHVESPPTIVNNKLYVGAGDDGLYAFDLQAEEPQKFVWQRPGIHLDSSPVATGELVIAGSVLGDIQKEFALLAVNAVTGEQAWKLPSPYPVPGAPAFADGNVYVTLGRGKMDHEDENPAGAVWSVDATKGERLWEFPLPSGALNSPAIWGELVLVTCRDGNLYAIERQSGNLRWKLDLAEPLVTAPAVTGSQAIVVTTGGTIAAVDLTRGAEVWRIDDLRTEDEDAYSSPVIAAGKLFVAIGNKVHCLGGK